MSSTTDAPGEPDRRRFTIVQRADEIADVMQASHPSDWALLPMLPPGVADASHASIEAFYRDALRGAGVPGEVEPRVYAHVIPAYVSRKDRPLTTTEARNVGWFRVMHRLLENARAR